MKLSPILLSSSLVLTCACGGDEATESSASQPPATAAEAPPPATDHGESLDLGTLTVAGKAFHVVRLGALEPGKESAFEVHPVDLSPADLADLNLYLWVESQDGTQLSAPSKGNREGDALHFHVAPRAGAGQPFRVVLRLRQDGTDERAGLPLDGHGHEHHEAPHGGVPAQFEGGATSGWLELKLHDDKGDLELWLAQDRSFEQPFDLPLDSEVEVELIDAGDRMVTLTPRDRQQNPDEDGTPNVRDGKTNYFVYPGNTDADTGWLQGKDFQSIAVVRFTRGGQQLESEEFVLKPHVH